eukprot:355964-Alexandrium_andersonii.AAC.1
MARGPGQGRCRSCSAPRAVPGAGGGRHARGGPVRGESEADLCERREGSPGRPRRPENHLP